MERLTGGGTDPGNPKSMSWRANRPSGDEQQPWGVAGSSTPITNNVSPLGVARPCPVDAARQRGAQTNLDAESIGYTGDIERRIFRARPGGRHQAVRHQAERRATNQRRAETMNAPSRVGLSQGLLRTSRYSERLEEVDPSGLCEVPNVVNSAQRRTCTIPRSGVADARTRNGRVFPGTY